MSEFWMIACKKPVPTASKPRFSTRQMERFLTSAPRLPWEKQTPRNPTEYTYLGLSDPPDDEMSPSFWSDTAEGAVVFKTPEEAETAAFLICTKHMHLLGCLELFSYGG